MALKNMLTREIKYTRKTEKSAFRKIFVARYIPILQYFLMVLLSEYKSVLIIKINLPTVQYKTDSKLCIPSNIYLLNIQKCLHKLQKSSIIDNGLKKSCLFPVTLP